MSEGNQTAAEIPMEKLSNNTTAVGRNIFRYEHTYCNFNANAKSKHCKPIIRLTPPHFFPACSLSGSKMRLLVRASTSVVYAMLLSQLVTAKSLLCGFVQPEQHRCTWISQKYVQCSGHRSQFLPSWIWCSIKSWRRKFSPFYLR